MDFLSTVVLGGIAGLTIYLGLPIARLKNLSKGVITFLNALAIGILLFLVVDIVVKGLEPIETAMENVKKGDVGNFALLMGLFIIGLGVGLLSLAYFDSMISRRKKQMAKIGESSPEQIALMIAIGIGLHNFSEGLAIGQASRSGALSLAALLIIGFGLHNATEGFGVAAPLTNHPEGKLPTWASLGLLGLIAGGPTFIGTIIGFNVYSEPIFVLCLALAAGSIIYVLSELFHVGRRAGLREIMMWGVFIGFILALLTDLFLTYSGA